MATLELASSILRAVIEPALSQLPEKMQYGGVSRFMLAIAIQESDLLHRVQIIDTDEGPKPVGPARGLWQFERNGGTKGVLQHLVTRELAQQVARKHGVEPMAGEVWHALAFDDLLAAKFARLLLWTDPDPLPTARQEAWNYYLRNWRPGKPHRARWTQAWKLALEA